MTAKASVKVRKEVRVRASRNRTDQHEKPRRRTSFELDHLDDLASKVVVAHNTALSVSEAILEVYSDLQYVPHGTKADPDPQYRMMLLGTLQMIQSLLFTCGHIERFVAPPLEREVRRLAPVPLTPSEEAREGLERLKRLRSRK
jgi:hypothetical protein